MFELRAQLSVVGPEEGQPEGLDRVLQGLGSGGRILPPGVGEQLCGSSSRS